MKLNWINQMNTLGRSVALGTFDGVHRGHQELFKQTTRLTPSSGSSCVFTFDIPPEQYFRGHARLLCSFERKAELIAKSGIDEVAWVPFGPEISSLDRSEFVQKILVDQLQSKQIICGFDYRFGKKRSGDVTYLREQGRQHGFEVTVVQAVQENEGEKISSTAIREFLAAGALDKAIEYLGYYPSYKGMVVRGAGRGRQLGFPTANLRLDPQLVLPGEGVYLTWCVLPNQLGFPAVTSVGRNPTFNGTVQTVEAYILDFDSDLYGQTLEIQFLQRLRDVVRYNSSEQLQKQIEADVDQSRHLLNRFHLQDSRIVLK